MQDSMSTPSMSEEQACLVRPRSDSDNSSKLGSFGSIARTMAYTEATDGAGEPGNPINAANPVAELNMDTNDSGELIDYDDANALDMFHEDAMRQAGFGLYQLRVFLAGGLGVMSCALELAAIPLILPQAEQELCILPHEKTWLMTISMLGVCGGAWAWGGVAALAGRRRALLSALAVHATFAAVAAFTPTYPTNMMARFCSAIGSGGVLPAAYTYVAESCPAARRGLLLPPLLLLAGAGGLYASAAAAALVHPQNAPSTTAHFSAWHKYLLLCTLPSLSALVCLIWTHESPAYLLSAGMQHAACNVYQEAGEGLPSNISADIWTYLGIYEGSRYLIWTHESPAYLLSAGMQHAACNVYQVISGDIWGYLKVSEGWRLVKGLPGNISADIWIYLRAKGV
ncbi:hypothetical protein JYU34_001175 [Plutella xylostella]|uniref:Major facilitator superfamily (MFS) profile domain-containing protein n=1 Tax=Plutella xylostella TaxID=51655 RepID=A0ABQ7R666_PLUXY|nr:hypothetical protein JYU34_001175 [Plutella xylostella]